MAAKSVWFEYISQGNVVHICFELYFGVCHMLWAGSYPVRGHSTPTMSKNRGAKKAYPPPCQSLAKRGELGKVYFLSKVICYILVFLANKTPKNMKVADRGGAETP